MISRHFVGTTSFTIASVYGFPAGPTWPRSRELTEQLLQPLTKEVVIGATGCRIIQGDFNQTVGSLDAFQIWRHYGWVEAQCLAQHHWGRCISATCKNATTVDLMWLSPKAATLCMQVGTLDVFMEHQTVFADFHLPARPMLISRWPQPSQIDWDEVDLPAWRASLIHPPGPSHTTGAADDFYAAWATHWETALDGHVQDQPRRQLPRRCRGRASRTRPCKMPLTTPVAKPSRQGEAQLRSNFLSLATHKWFKQLRRLQSFKHAAQANKATVDAETYRLLLWQAIKQASGFHMDFPSWWRQRPHKTPTAPHELLKPRRRRHWQKRSSRTSSCISTNSKAGRSVRRAACFSKNMMLHAKPFSKTSGTLAVVNWTFCGIPKLMRFWIFAWKPNRSIWIDQFP